MEYKGWNRLVVAKAGRSPWWPSEVIEREPGRIQVTFLTVNQSAWVDEADIVRIRTREDLDIFLEEKRGIDGGNMRYSNIVPEAMTELYANAWKLYGELWIEDSDESCSNNEEGCSNNNKRFINKISNSFKEKAVECFKVPCEVCVKKNIEKECGPVNSKLIGLSEYDRDIELSLMMVSNNDDVTQCDNYCQWKYHSRCVNSESDLICSCNKSSWICSVCDEKISVTQIFICDNHECMRAYHKTCISAHLDLQPDIKECPLHQCINCKLDGLQHSNDVSLAYCIKCKIAFHNTMQCLPSVFMTVTGKYIICGRHLLSLEKLRSTSADFCFSCHCSTKDVPTISCLYCLVTYHNTVKCLPSSLDLNVNNQNFICNGCNFPLVRRSQYMILSPPTKFPADIHLWKMGLSERSQDFETLHLHDIQNTETYRTSIYNIISINLQSLDNLICFGLSRFLDMQKAIHHLSTIVNSLVTFSTSNIYRRNAFILNYSSLFPIIDNIYDIVQVSPSESDLKSIVKCACSDYCSTQKCSNVAANNECTQWNCNSLSRCRNRRLQKRHFPKQKLVIGDEKTGPYIALEEAVVKDILVMELVGRVKLKTTEDSVKHGNRLFILSNTLVIDNSRYCGLSRFVQHSEWPNLLPQCWNVNGSQRLGLFSKHRIAANETLSVNMNQILLRRDVDSSLTSSLNLVPWSEFILIDENMEDSSPEYISNSKFLKQSMNVDGSIVRKETFVINQRPPLCPICLNELTSEYSTCRTMIHCVNCYTVHHLQCAYSKLTIAKYICRLEKDPRLMKFVCELCRSIVDD